MDRAMNATRTHAPQSAAAVQHIGQHVVRDTDSRHREDADQIDSSEESDHDADAIETGNTSSEEEEVDWLATGRSRRSTQGNRYATLLAQEAARQVDQEDELEQLFAEQEDQEDDEFADADVQSDAEWETGSSDTDEDDRGPAVGQDELEGEKQLKTEERATKKAQKRKADRVGTKPSTSRKRLRIDQQQSVGQVEERKRKIPERLSWAPKDAPLRTSSRTLSMQNKQRTMASMKETEAKRIRQIAVMEAAHRRKNASKVRPMTQVERLEEAARTERVNSKSLNRWEETEKERVKKQAQRLEALQNRKIEGPVIRWYSAKSEWWDDKLRRIGKIEVVDTDEAFRKRGVKNLKVADAPPSMQSRQSPTAKESILGVAEGAGETAVTDPGSTASSTTLVRHLCRTDDNIDGAETTSSPCQDPSRNGFITLMEEMQQYASKEDQSEMPAEPQTAEHSKTAVEDGATSQPQPADKEERAKQAQQLNIVPSVIDNCQASIVSGTPSEKQQITSTAHTNRISIPFPHNPGYDISAADSAPPSASHTITHSAYNSLTLLHFSPELISNLSIQKYLLLGHPLPSSLSASVTRTKSTAASRNVLIPPKPIQPICVITSQPAKYKDPTTGLAYKDVDAFRRLRKVTRGDYVWSRLLSAWVGARDANVGMPAFSVIDGDVVMKNEAVS